MKAFKVSKQPLLAIIAAVVIFVLIISALYTRANAGNEAIQREPLTVAVVPIEKLSQYQLERWFSGRIQPRQQVQLASELAGKVQSVQFDEGDLIESGSIVIELDKSLLTSEKTSLESQVSGIDAELALSKLRLGRQSNLRGKGFSSVETIDEIETNITNLESRRKTLLTQMNTLNIRLKKSTLRAPFTAIVQRRLVDIGAVVNAGTPLLELVEQAQPEVKVGLPGQLVSQLKVGQKYSLVVSNKAIDATLLSIAPAVDLVTQTVAARFRLPLDINSFNLGEFSRLKLSITQNESGFWIPNTALIEGEHGLWSFYIVNTDNRVQKHSAEIIATKNDRSYIKANIAAEALVIQSGLNRIAPDMQVKY